jgi:hypothetical protein
MEYARVVLSALVVSSVMYLSEGQQLVAIKELPKKITGIMCECADGLRSDSRTARGKEAQRICSAQEGIELPDLEAYVKEETKKPMERFLGQWSRKQLENPGVNNKCINTMREVYVYQAKLNSLMKPFSKEKQEAYAKCFGMQMGWLKENGELDKVAIRKEIGGAQNLDPKLRQSLELLSLTCRGTNFNDMESYVKCTSKPCLDADFFDTVLGKKAQDGKGKKEKKTA